MGRHHLCLQKQGWLGSHFVLINAHTCEQLGEADRAGWLTSRWRLSLSIGPAELVSAGPFNTAYRVIKNGRSVATVDRAGFCEGGWSARGDAALRAADLLLVGLIYHTILDRHRRSD
jgi:hypothetical protein